MDNLDAEKAVIGALLIKPILIDDIVEILDAADFQSIENGLLYSSIQEIGSDSLDIITLSQHLSKNGLLDNVGGMKALSEIYTNTPSAANATSYARIVKDGAQIRRLMYKANELVIKLREATDYKDAQIQVSSILDSVEVETEGYKPFKEIVKGLMIDLDARMKSGGGFKGLKTGFNQLDNMLMGLNAGDYFVIGARPSMGKELTMDSLVLLSTGEFKPMGDMRMNDLVASIDGKESKVTGVYPQGVKPVYKMTFSDGRSVDAGLDHQWEVMFRMWKEPRVMTTAQLIEKMKSKRYRNRLFIPNHSGDFGIDEGITIDPYLMGVLLGDGSLAGNGVRLTTSSEHIKQKIEGSLLGCSLNPINKTNNIDYRISNKKGAENKILTEVRSFGLGGALSHQKFIPKNYLAASKESRLNLIRGLIDTDGTIEKTGSMTYTTTSKQLADDVQALARSLGAYASMSTRITQYTYLDEKKSGKRAYTIYISCEHYGEFVTLPEKKTRIQKQKRNRNLNIMSIEYIGDFECQCISVDHPRSLYISDGYTVTHNTAFSLALCQNIAKEYGDVLYFSAESTKEALGSRVVTSMGNVDSKSMRTATLSSEKWTSLMANMDAIMNLPVHIIDHSGIDIAHARAIAKKFNRKKKINAIFVDYIQLMTCKKSKGDFESVSNISRGLKAMAKENECPVIALAQLSRGVEQRPDKRPNMSDLRATGQIEQDADFATFLYRDEYYNDDSMDKGITEFLIKKNRDGETGKVFFKSNFSTMRYEEINYTHQHQEESYKPFKR